MNNKILMKLLLLELSKRLILAEEVILAKINDINIEFHYYWLISFNVQFHV